MLASLLLLGMIRARSYWWALASLPLMIVGALGPWAETFGVRVDGSQDEVVLLLAVASGLLLVLLATSRRAWLALLPVLTGLTAAGLTGNDIRDISDFVPRVSDRLVTLEWGIYLALLGSTSLALASVLLFVETAKGRDSIGRKRPGETADSVLGPGGRSAFATDAGAFTPYVAVETDGERFGGTTLDWGAGALFLLPTRQKSGVDRFAKPEWKETQHLRRALDVLGGLGVDAARGAFIDVGAHFGTTTIMAVHQFGFESALAFEPDKANFRLLCANVAVNGLDERIRTFNMAVSDTVAEAELALRPDRRSKHRLLPGHEEAENTARIALVTLDSLVEDGLIDPARVGLVRLDVEGHELEALDGARRLLDRAVPIVMEFGRREFLWGGRLRALASLLRQHYTAVADLRLNQSDAKIHPLDALLARRHRGGFTNVLVFRQTRPGAPTSGREPFDKGSSARAASDEGEEPIIGSRTGHAELRLHYY